MPAVTARATGPSGARATPEAVRRASLPETVRPRPPPPRDGWGRRLRAGRALGVRPGLGGAGEVGVGEFGEGGDWVFPSRWFSGEAGPRAKRAARGPASPLNVWET